MRGNDGADVCASVKISSLIGPNTKVISIGSELVIEAETTFIGKRKHPYY